MELISRYYIKEPTENGRVVTIGEVCKKYNVDLFHFVLGPTNQAQILEVYELKDGIRFKFKKIK